MAAMKDMFDPVHKIKSPSPLAGEGWGGGRRATRGHVNLSPRGRLSRARHAFGPRPPTPTLPREGGGGRAAAP
jgi:hypothetical protein